MSTADSATTSPDFPASSEMPCPEAARPVRVSSSDTVIVADEPVHPAAGAPGGHAAEVVS
ncbi:hypothetical protein [Lentzea sp. NEAU-D7]|uniref:hypothetical protein n=1 Tax=Lentzea sp. NEAU-D7 TaxID=2994667 RepID=UPI00224ABF47|nr:hypothetical protein [Lentzea sp. NEAU-D7]MCX2954734.1 hypothetical protein [Lentzea sp. NEAU-D7]